MKDIFGEFEDSPEIRLFEMVRSPFDYEEALALYRTYLKDNLTEEEALALAAEEVVPTSWSDLSASQLQEQLSS